jgi:hypothetical protein
LFFRQFGSMFLQFDQIVEGIGITSFAGIDETHKQVADLSAVSGFIEAPENHNAGTPEELSGE